MTEQNSTPAATVTASNRSRRGPGIRWWPLVVILLIAALALGWIWFFHDAQRQDRNLMSAPVMLAAALLAMLWLLFASRMRWSIRLSLFAGCVVVIAAVPALFQIRGVTGDLIPVLEWRWSTSDLPDASRDGTAAGGPDGGSAASPIGPVRSDHDYNQFLGPNRDATVSGPLLNPDWSGSPPVERWRQPVGPAWSGFATSGAFAVTQEQRGDQEMITCYRLSTGEPLWSHSDTARYFTTIAGEGPRATPTLHDGRVYAVGATGILNCLDLIDGTVLWSKDITVDNQVQGGRRLQSEWGYSGSPLIHDDLVVVSPGGESGRSLAAYDRVSGERIWTGGDGKAGYSSPVAVTLDGIQQIVVFNAGHVAGHSPDDGRVLWTYDWGIGKPHVAIPIAVDANELFVSSGYGVGAERLRIGRTAEASWSVTSLWKSNRMKAKFTNVVSLDGFVYGLDDGIMACLELETGRRMWKGGRYGHGQIILARNLMVVMTETGEVALVRPNPETLDEVARFHALSGKTWNPPALAGAMLLVRNDREAACYELPVIHPAETR